MKYQLVLGLAAIFLAGCQKDVSGTYLSNDVSSLDALQIVRTPDNRLSGQIAHLSIGPDGKIAEVSTPITGAVNGENITISVSRAFGLDVTTLTGTLVEDRLTIVGLQTAPSTLTRTSQSVYQREIQALVLRSQNIVAAKTAVENRERTAGEQRHLTSQIDGLLAKMSKFETAVDLHLGKLAGAEERHRSLTSRINWYVEQQRRSASSPLMAVHRSQLSADAEQAEIDNDQLHLQEQSLEQNYQQAVKSLGDEAKNLQTSCSITSHTDLSPEQIETHRRFCDRLTDAVDTFQEKANTMAAGLVHLEQVYQQEQKTQSGLLEVSGRLR